MKPFVDVIILGAKPIKGMKSLGAFSNIKINKQESILDLQITNLNKKLNIKNIIYIGGYKCQNLEYDNIRLIENEQYLNKNNAYSLKLALPFIKSDYVVILFNKTIFSHTIFNRLNYNKSYIFIDNSEDNDYALGCILNENRIENIFYNLPNKLCGIYALCKEDIESLKNLSTDINDNLFIFEIINKLIENNCNFTPKFIKKIKSIFTIDSGCILKKFKRYYAKNFSA